jgi:hypothetical protein
VVATLRRHGLSEKTEVYGISYGAEGGPVTVNIAGKRLVVPEDVLAMPGPMPAESPRRTLFSRPD